MMDDEGWAARLRLSFDPARLEHDLHCLMDVPRMIQPGCYHNGEWVGISLRSIGGNASARPSLPSLESYQDSALLDNMPYFREVLSTLRVPKLCVRVLFLP